MANLSDLKVGDPVVIWSTGYGATPNVGERATVTEVTRGGNFKVSGSTAIWNKSGGYRGQGSYSRQWLERFDQKVWDENQERVDESRDRLLLKNFNFSNVPIQTVRAILSLLKPSI